MNDTRPDKVTFQITVDFTEVNALIAKVESILQKEGLHNKPMIEGLAQLEHRFRQQRLHVLSLIEEKQALFRENEKLQMALESALCELRILASGKKISDFYEEFMKAKDIYYVK